MNPLLKEKSIIQFNDNNVFKDLDFEQFTLWRIPKMYRNAELKECQHLDKIQAFIESKDTFLYVYGKCGRGKTYFLYALLKHLRKKRLRRVTKDSDGIIYLHPQLIWDCYDVAVTLRHSFSPESSTTESSILNQLTNKDVVGFDDLGTQKASEYSLEIWQNIIDTRLKNEIKTVFTSNLSIKELSVKMSDRIASRIASGVILEFGGKDRRILHATPQQ